MNGFIKGLLAFTAGAFIGGFVTKKYMEKKHELEMEEEYLESETVENKEDDDDRNMTFEEFWEGETGKPIYDVEDREEYEMIRAKYDTITQNIERTNAEAEHYNDDVPSFEESPRYNGRDDLQDESLHRVDVVNDPDEPYFIEEDEFEILDDWDSDEYTLFADGYVTDSYGLPIENNQIDEMFGVGFHTRFEQEGSDQVWIRNDKLRMDFSIVRDLSNFKDVAPARVKRMMGIQ